MPVQLPAELAAVLAKAFTSGVETTLCEMSELFGWASGDPLAAAAGVVDSVAGLGLEFVPPPNSGEFRSVRVLRPVPASDGLLRVSKLMQAGEGQTVEYKSSMHCSMADWGRDRSLVEHPSLPGEVLKTICAFLNSDGGDLLVGVDDDGSVCEGVGCDLSVKAWNLDQWQLHLNSLVTSRFILGTLVLPYIQVEAVEFDTAPVVRVAVMARTRRSFVQRTKGQAYEFFVRNGPQTTSLDLPGFYEHLIGDLKTGA